VIGFDVRQLNWDGGVDGTTRGDVAKRVMERCLALQVHLMGDWECKLEYSRSLSMALLGWTSWHSQLPGCCFAEEFCEPDGGASEGQPDPVHL